jgi:hypothetical protein
MRHCWGVADIWQGAWLLTRSNAGSKPVAPAIFIMTNWQLVKDTLNKNKKVLRSSFYHEPFGVLSSTMDEYLWLLRLTGYIEIAWLPVTISSQGLQIGQSFCILKRKIPESLTISELAKIKKQPWLAWFKQYEK